jgi:hypothetical protein
VRFVRFIAVAVTLSAGAAQAQQVVETTVPGSSPIEVIPSSPFGDGSAIKAQEDRFRQEGAMLDYGVKTADQAKTSLSDFQTKLNKAIASNSYTVAAQILAVSGQTLAQAQAIDAQVFRFTGYNDSPAGRDHTAADASLAAAQQTFAQMRDAFLPLAKREMASALEAQTAQNEQFAAGLAAQRAAAETWNNKITGSLGELSACFAGAAPPSGANCNVFVGRTLETVYGFSDFKAADGHYLLANEIADYLVTSPNWTLIGVADNQSVLVQAADSAASRPVVAVWRNPDLNKHGHVVLIGPGPLQLSGWGLMVPNSAGFSMDNAAAGYIGGKLSNAFGNDKKSSVLVYVRSKP